MIKTSTTPTPDPLHHNHRLPPLLRSVWYSINQAFRKRIAHLEITPNQYTLLRWLSEAPRTGLSQRELTDLMASDANTITALLTRMQSKGLIERKPHESDRRAYRITLKSPGRKLYKKTTPIAENLQNEVLAHLKKPERTLFLKQLATLAQTCQKALDDSE